MGLRLLSRRQAISPTSGDFAAGVIQLLDAAAGVARAEIGPDVVRELGQHLVRNFPLGLAQPLLDEPIDGGANQLRTARSGR